MQIWQALSLVVGTAIYLAIAVFFSGVARAFWGKPKTGAGKVSIALVAAFWPLVLGLYIVVKVLAAAFRAVTWVGKMIFASGKIVGEKI